MVNPNVMHVVPVGDLIEHDTSGEEDCVCGPRTRPVEQDAGGMGWVIVHNSLDGREQHEGSTP